MEDDDRIDRIKRILREAEDRKITLSLPELAQLMRTTQFTVLRLLKKARLRLGDDPVIPVPASLRPRPSRNSGAVALPEPEED